MALPNLALGDVGGINCRQPAVAVQVHVSEKYWGTLLSALPQKRTSSLRGGKYAITAPSRAGGPLAEISCQVEPSKDHVSPSGRPVLLTPPKAMILPPLESYPPPARIRTGPSTRRVQPDAV